MKIIYTVEGFEILVDDEDFDILNRFRWRAQYSNGGRRKSPVTSLFGHRGVVGPQHLVFGRSCGQGKVIDHIDRNPFNNQKNNLRSISIVANAWNRGKGKGKKKATSKFLGVYHNKRTGKYYAEIQTGKKKNYLGGFVNEVDAALAYDKKAKEIRGEYAFLNFPEKK